MSSLLIPNDLSGCKILDLGCQIGAFSLECKKRGADLTVAVDVDANNIKCARKIAEFNKSDIKFIRSSIDNPRQCLKSICEFSSSFDYVLCLAVISHVRHESLVLLLNNLQFKNLLFEGHNRSFNKPEDMQQLINRTGLQISQQVPIGVTVDRKRSFCWLLTKLPAVQCPMRFEEKKSILIEHIDLARRDDIKLIVYCLKYDDYDTYETYINNKLTYENKTRPKRYGELKRSKRTTKRLIQLYYSIKDNGLKEPIIVYDMHEDRTKINSKKPLFVIIGGRHRLACCLALNHKHVEVQIVSGTGEQIKKKAKVTLLQNPKFFYDMPESALNFLNNNKY